MALPGTSSQVIPLPHKVLDDDGNDGNAPLIIPAPPSSYARLVISPPDEISWKNITRLSATPGKATISGEEFKVGTLTLDGGDSSYRIYYRVDLTDRSSISYVRSEPYNYGTQTYYPYVRKYDLKPPSYYSTLQQELQDLAFVLVRMETPESSED